MMAYFVFLCDVIKIKGLNCKRAIHLSSRDISTNCSSWTTTGDSADICFFGANQGSSVSIGVPIPNKYHPKNKLNARRRPNLFLTNNLPGKNYLKFFIVKLRDFKYVQCQLHHVGAGADRFCPVNAGKTNK